MIDSHELFELVSVVQKSAHHLLAGLPPASQSRHP